MGAISPKGGTVKCYFGVSPKKITVMDEKTKVITWKTKHEIPISFIILGWHWSSKELKIRTTGRDFRPSHRTPPLPSVVRHCSPWVEWNSLEQVIAWNLDQMSHDRWWYRGNLFAFFPNSCHGRWQITSGDYRFWELAERIATAGFCRT